MKLFLYFSYYPFKFAGVRLLLYPISTSIRLVLCRMEVWDCLLLHVDIFLCSSWQAICKSQEIPMMAILHGLGKWARLLMLSEPRFQGGSGHGYMVSWLFLFSVCMATLGIRWLWHVHRGMFLWFFWHMIVHGQQGSLMVYWGFIGCI